MNLDRWIAICSALVVLALPGLSLADHHNAGGEAAEHRSERAAERSNAQWDEGNEGRPDKDRAGDADADEADADEEAGEDEKNTKEEKAKKGKKDKKGKPDKGQKSER